MSTCYKATRPDGTDFRTGTVRYEVGTTVTHPNPGTIDASRYLSVATVPTDCTGMQWPCRLFEVTAADVWEGGPDFPNKRCCHELTVVREVDAHLALGPQGREVAALVERAGSLTATEVRELAAARYAAWGAARVAAWGAARDAARLAARLAAVDAAWAAAWDAAWAAAWDAAWDAARAAARDAAWDAARDAAWALTLRDLIGTHGFTQEHYDLLTGPWRKTIGQLHPGDGDPS